MTKNSKFNNVANESLSQSGLIYHLAQACYYGDLDEVRYFLTSSELKEKANINYYQQYHGTVDDPLSMAAMGGHLHIIEYLLTSSELKEHANIGFHNCKVVKFAIMRNHVDIINFCLFSPLLNPIQKDLINKGLNDIVVQLLIKEKNDIVIKIMNDIKHFDIQGDHDYILRQCVEARKPEAIKKLLEYGSNINNVYYKNGQFLKDEITYYSIDFLRFMVFECNLEYKESYKSYNNTKIMSQIKDLVQEKEIVIFSQALDKKLTKNKIIEKVPAKTKI